MQEIERYEEFRKYYEDAEKREQGYIVTIQRLMQRIKDLEMMKNE